MEELLPKGINRFNTRSRPYTSIYLKNAGSIKGIVHQNTFEVVEKHEQITDPSNGTVNGVSFNVETLPKPLEKHRNLNIVDRTKAIESFKAMTAKFYNKEANEVAQAHETQEEFHFLKDETEFHKVKDMRIEAAASHDSTTNGKLVHVGGNGFLVAAISAFAYHLPLTLAPDHIWMLINYAFAKHVDQNAEELRNNFVQHEGKKRLLVTTGEGFLMSRDGNPDTGASAEEWESIVFADFSCQIKEYIGEKTHSTIAEAFSTTSKGSQAANEITLMAAMKNYFSYGMCTTLCGIPKVTLLGTEEDWVKLRGRAEALGPLMKPDFSDSWMPFLLPVLDQFVESYRGNVNHSFWQTMVKLRGTSGSGAYDFISGWMQILFPILASGSVNRCLRSWQDMYFSGPDPDDFPDIVSIAPVDWEYKGKTFNLNFHAGVMGCSQDCNTGALMPVISWFVSHSPEQPPKFRLGKIENELKGLWLGHKEEAESKTIDKTQPWYHRVLALESEKAELERIASEQEKAYYWNDDGDKSDDDSESDDDNDSDCESDDDDENDNDIDNDCESVSEQDRSDGMDNSSVSRSVPPSHAVLIQDDGDEDSSSNEETERTFNDVGNEEISDDESETSEEYSDGDSEDEFDEESDDEGSAISTVAMKGQEEDKKPEGRMDIKQKFRMSKRGVFSTSARTTPKRRGVPHANTANSIEMKGMAKAARRRKAEMHRCY